MPACEGEWHSVWVSGATAQAAVFFSSSRAGERARIAASQFAQARFIGPVLEDANAVQLALMRVMQLLGSGQMDHKTAGLMLYALQTASINLRHVQFEPLDVTDVVIDRSDVNRTCIGGQQWFEEDFEDEEEDGDEEEASAEDEVEGSESAVEAEEDEEEEDGEEEVAEGEVPEEEVAEVRAHATVQKAQATVQKKEAHVSIDEARRQVHGLIYD